MTVQSATSQKAIEESDWVVVEPKPEETASESPSIKVDSSSKPVCFQTTAKQVSGGFFLTAENRIFKFASKVDVSHWKSREFVLIWQDQTTPERCYRVVGLESSVSDSYLITVADGVERADVKCSSVRLKFQGPT